MHRLFVCLTLLASPVWAADFVHAVEFPYQQYPRHLWERELVWLKNIGIKTVAIRVVAAAPADPRTDTAALLDTLRRLDLEVWVRETPQDLVPALKPYAGNPIRYAENAAELGKAAPQPVTRVSAVDNDAWRYVQDAITKGKGSLLWTDVEDVLTPVLRKGAVSFSGEESEGAKVLRRTSSFLRFWSGLLPAMDQRRKLTTAPAALQIGSAKGPGLVLISNTGKTPFSGGIRIADPLVQRYLKIPKLDVPAGVSMWIPVNVPFRWPGVCEDCGVLEAKERLLYATAELQNVEYENGILAFEFHAPVRGEAVLQLAHKPQGPVLAAGHPAEFDWEEASLAARIAIPAGKPPLYRQRVAIALDVGESAAFFSGSKERLIQGIPNRIVTSYSSDTVLNETKLIVPAGYQVKEATRSPLTVEYDVIPPATAMHGEFVTLVLEHKGARLARTRAQVLSPVRLRMREVEPLRLGADRSLTVEQPVITVDPRGGRSLTLVFRNNLPSIANFKIEFKGDGVSVPAPSMDTSVGGATEREFPLRVFLDSNSSSQMRTLKVSVTGAASAEHEFKFVPLARGQAISYAVDLDGDGIEDPVLENSVVRASFSGADGRWIEYLSKDRGANLLPESGLLPLGSTPVVSQSKDGSAACVTFTSGRIARTFMLSGADTKVTVSQDAPFSTGPITPQRREGLELRMEQAGPGQVIFQLQRF